MAKTEKDIIDKIEQFTQSPQLRCRGCERAGHPDSSAMRCTRDRNNCAFSHDSAIIRDDYLRRLLVEAKNTIRDLRSPPKGVDSPENYSLMLKAEEIRKIAAMVKASADRIDAITGECGECGE